MELNRYRGNHKGLFFVICFRITYFFANNKFLRIIGFPIWLLYRLVFNWILGIDIYERTQIGKGFVVWHGIGLIVHPSTIIGNNVTLRHNTTIGVAKSGGRAPVLEDGVNVGPNVVIIGNVRIGENAIIGAGAVVVSDIPANSVAVGNPARVVSTINDNN